MQHQPKRRARLKKGFAAPEVAQPKAALTSWEEYQQKREQRERRAQERLRNRKPLPTEEEIRERFLQSTLRYFASADVEFWQDSHQRFFYYPSDFMGKLRLGPHLDSYEKVLAMCMKVRFPELKCGRIEAKFNDDQEHRANTPDISYRMAEMAEWNQAQAELRQYLGMSEYVETLSSKAQALVDFAASIPKGTMATVQKEVQKAWSFEDCESAVSEAQKVDPRLFVRGKHANAEIVVLEKPLSLLTLPSLDASLNFPKEASKQDLDRLSRLIEDIAKNECFAGHLSNDWLVLVRTKTRTQAKKSFGNLSTYDLERVCAKLRPVGMVVLWHFPNNNLPWLLAVRPDENLNWSDVVQMIDAASNELSSEKKYGLSKEAAALLDWLRQLPKHKFQWNLAPEMTEELLRTEIGLKNPWSGENAFLLFRLLAEEISRKTPFVAVAHPWAGYGMGGARIEFRKNENVPGKAA